MNRRELKEWILKNYNAETDFPWANYPAYEVFRHPENRKWFALVMEVPKSRLGLSGDDTLDVVNFKCDPLFIGSLLGEPGFYPAYHMSKTNWITVALDGTVSEELIRVLLDRSFILTAAKRKY